MMAQAESIAVEFTAAPEYVAVARRVVEVVGARAGLAPLQLEDLQIAVSEVCNRLVTAAHAAHAEGQAVTVRFWLEGDSVVAEMGGRGEPTAAALAHLLDDEFPTFLLRRLVDDVTLTQTPHGPVLRLLKKRQGPLP
jgi:anti-sigma regulatory factor (Ser/Thr protein kinase)